MGREALTREEVEEIKSERQMTPDEARDAGLHGIACNTYRPSKNASGRCYWCFMLPDMHEPAADPTPPEGTDGE